MNGRTAGSVGSSSTSRVRGWIHRIPNPRAGPDQFASPTLEYVVSVANSVEDLTFTPTLDAESATVTVNGNPVESGLESPSVALEEGENTITIVVTAGDGIITQTYVVTVIRRRVPTVEVTGPFSFTYDGSPQGPAQATNTGTGSSYTFQYEGFGDTEFGPVAEPPVGAGTYRVTATVAPSDDGLWDDGTSAATEFTIDRAAGTITLGDLSQVYDGTVRAPTATTDPANLPVAVTYRLNGEEVTGPTEVGSYQVTATITDANFTGEATGTLEIAPRPITVTAQAAAKLLGDDDPPLTFEVTEGSLAAGDELSGELSREAGEDVGTYAIQQGTLANPNYQITFVGADFTIDVGRPDAGASTVSADPTEVRADGQEVATLTVTARDRGQNPLSGRAVRLEPSVEGRSTISTGSNGGITDAAGQVTFQVLGEDPLGGEVIYSALVGSGPDEVRLSATASVIFLDVTPAIVTGPTELEVSAGEQVVASFEANEPVVWTLVAHW